MNILKEDDDEAVLPAVGMALNHLGLMVMHVTCGEETLALAESYQSGRVRLRRLFVAINLEQADL